MKLPVPVPAEFDAVRELARRGDLGAAAQQAAVLFNRTPDGSEERGEAAQLLGGIAFEQGRLEEAERHLEEAMRVARARGDVRLAARASNNLASIAHLRGKETLAISLYRSAMLVWQSEGDAAGVAQASHNLGLVFRQQGDLAAAASASARAVRAACLSGDTALEGTVRLGQAEVALAEGALDRAGIELNAARRCAEAAGDGLGQAESARLEGAIALAAGQFATALRRAGLGQRRALRLGGLQCAAECAELAYRASLMLRRARSARHFYQAAVMGYAALPAGPALRRLEAARTG